MAKHRSTYLIDQLIRSKLSRAELDEFLAGLHSEDDRQAYSDVLEIYFNTLLNQHEHLPESEEKPAPIPIEIKPGN